MFSSPILALLSAATLASAHTVITYPGWRGDNLVTNDTFPYGMQWMYPCKSNPASNARCDFQLQTLALHKFKSTFTCPDCKTDTSYAGGGHPTTTNRTYWPTTGGAVALQPGWFQGHQTAFIYINLGFGTDGPDGGPQNMSNPMVSPFQIIGPNNNPYPGTICIPEVPLPTNTTVKAGDNATIQVVEIAKHGAALFSVSPVQYRIALKKRRTIANQVYSCPVLQCVDITFAEPGDARIPEVNGSNCFNSNQMGFADVYTIVTRESDADPDVTSGASPDTTVFFWYFGRQGGAGSAWNYLALAPVVLGMALMMV